jgi:predicted dehydrogenase
MRKIGIGAVGCGVISHAYLSAMKYFPNIELKAMSDMRQAPAEQRVAAAIVANRPHRANGALALLALEAMEAFQLSSDDGRRMMLTTTVERPAMLPPAMRDGQLA